MDDASRKMRDYLQNQQRKKEEFWMRKYGKPAPAALPSLTVNRAPFPPVDVLSPTNVSPTGDGLIKVNGRVALPPISHNGKPAHNKGNQPLFQAQGPIKNFFARGGYDTGPRNGDVPLSPGSQFKLPPLQHSHLDAQNKPTKAFPRLLPPLNGSGGGDDVLTLDSPSDSTYGSPAPQGAAAAATASPKRDKVWNNLWKQSADSPKTPGVFSSVFPRHEPKHNFHSMSHLPPLDAAEVAQRAAFQNRPLRDMELELAVLKAVKGREDNMERLKISCEKLEQHFGGQPPRFMSQTDPLVRLFFRLLHVHRQRTIDAIENIAAWRRKTAATEPFIYYGSDYLGNIGSDMSFLEQQGFLKGRQLSANDPFLADLTPDGIPIDEATALDLRRGHTHFSSDALRIRVARKVLAQYHETLRRADQTRTDPHDLRQSAPTLNNRTRDHNNKLQDMAALAASAGDDRYTGSFKKREGSRDGQGMDGRGRPGSRDVAGARSAPPKGHESMQLPALRSRPPSAPAAPLPPRVAESTDGGHAFELHAHAAPNGFPGDDLIPYRLLRTPESIEQHTKSATSNPVAQPAAFFGMSDDDFIDMTVDALVASLQPPVEAQFPPFRFTMAGWAALSPFGEDEEDDIGAASPFRHADTESASAAADEADTRQRPAWMLQGEDPPLAPPNASGGNGGALGPSGMSSNQELSLALPQIQVGDAQQDASATPQAEAEEEDDIPARPQWMLDGEDAPRSRPTRGASNQGDEASTAELANDSVKDTAPQGVPDSEGATDVPPRPQSQLDGADSDDDSPQRPQAQLDGDDEDSDPPPRRPEQRPMFLKVARRSDSDSSPAPVLSEFANSVLSNLLGLARAPVNGPTGRAGGSDAGGSSEGGVSPMPSPRSSRHGREGEPEEDEEAGEGAVTYAAAPVQDDGEEGDAVAAEGSAQGGAEADEAADAPQDADDGEEQPPATQQEDAGEAAAQDPVTSEDDGRGADALDATNVPDVAAEAEGPGVEQSEMMSNAAAYDSEDPPLPALDAGSAWSQDDTGVAA